MMHVEVGYSAKIQKTVSLALDVQLSENDIFNWLGLCSSPEILKYLGRYAFNCAKCIEDPDNDDFRSRA